MASPPTVEVIIVEFINRSEPYFTVETESSQAETREETYHEAHEPALSNVEGIWKKETFS
jgi:hypothetical protein